MVVLRKKDREPREKIAARQRRLRYRNRHRLTQLKIICPKDKIFEIQAFLMLAGFSEYVPPITNAWWKRQLEIDKYNNRKVTALLCAKRFLEVALRVSNN